MLRLIFILVTSGLTLVIAIPSCRLITETNLLCTPGFDDFVLKSGLVSDRSTLTYLTLRDCRVTDIEINALQNLPALYYLDLSRNKIKALTPGIFEGFPALTYLNISYNEITGFPLGLFDSINNLELLDLKGNRLTNIIAGNFNRMTKLKHLDISSNDYLGRHLYSDIFSNVHFLQFIDFSRNDMSETREDLLSAFVDIGFINLDRCYLPEVPAFVLKPNLKTMKRMFLSSNRIISLTDPNTFIYLEELEVLNLENNPIDYIVNGVFTPLKKLKSIVLVNNRLKQIPETLFRSLPMLNEVDLSRNALERLPVNAFRGSPIMTLVVSHNRLSYLPEDFCLELSRSGAKLKEFLFDGNPWQCACLRDVLDEMKHFEINYKSEKFNGQNPVCVTTTDFNCKRQDNAYSYFISLYFNTVL